MKSMSLSFNGCSFPRNKVSIFKLFGFWFFFLLYWTKTFKSCLCMMLFSVISEFNFFFSSRTIFKTLVK